MEEKNNQQNNIIDLGKTARLLWSKKKIFVKVWLVTFILSCIWIFPQPRYYVCEVKLAPEMNGEDVGGSLSSIASSFGFNIGGMAGQDAIYPELYPELFESPEFVVGLFGIKVTTKDGRLTTDYFTYMKSHQKRNPLTYPFLWIKLKITNLFETEDSIFNNNKVNSFVMSRKDFLLMQKVMKNISCAVDRKTSVITINVKDQDPLICATMADSVKNHLQDFIIRYRTSKASEDIIHYQEMRDSAEREYDAVMASYSRFCDAHQNVILQSFQSERDKLEKDLELKQNSLVAMETQLQSTKVKLQEKTPAFTTLKSAMVPVLPEGPKRMLFVIGMMILSFVLTSVYVLRKQQ